MSVRSVLRLALILVALAAVAAAQTQTCRLEGVVLDPAGAVVPNARIAATNIRTQVTLTATSNAEGNFVLAAMQPGLYNVTVDAAGFRRFVLSNVQMDAGATVAQNVHLEIGQSTEVVEVQANTVVVQTSESQVSRAVSMRDIDQLPVLNRQPIGLVSYAPGTSINPGDTSFTRINGLRQGSNNATLDGIDVNDAVVPRLGLSMTANNMDSVGEIRTITAGGKAEYGRNAGGQVEMITRSGTNSFHGNLFEYLRNTVLNANGFFSNRDGVRRPMFIQNIFGGSLGGPIIRDKLFFFGNLQMRRTHQQITRTRTVPTASAKQGIFTWSKGTYNIVANDPLHLGIDPVVKKLLDMYPDPNVLDGSVGDGLNSAGFRFNQPNNSLEDQFTVKGDYNMNPTNHFFYRHSWQRNSSIDSLNSADAPFPGGAQGTQGGHRWGIAAGWDWTVTNNLINEFRYGHQSASVAFLRPQRVAGLMYQFSSFTNPLYTGAEQGRNSPVNEFTENLTWIRAKHTVKAGINIRRVLQYGWNYAGVWPTATFATSYGAAVPASATPAGLSGADLTRYQNLYNDLLGRIAYITQTFFSDLKTYQPAGEPSVRNYVFNDSGSFIQDDWKIRPNLTLNVGLRWEIFGTPTEQNGLQGTVANIATLSPMHPANNLSVKTMDKWYKTDLNNFAPRFGFSWDPTGTGRMAIRGAYGIFYDRIIGATTSAVDSGSPGFAEGQTSYPNQNGDVRASQNPVMPQHGAAPLTTPLDNRGTTITVFNPNLATGYVHQYSLTVQREFLHNTIVEAGYVGNRGVKLFMFRDINQPTVYPDFLPAVRELQAFQANGTAPSPNNTLVRIFGSPQAAISGLGATNISQGLLGTLANNLDRNSYTKYAAAGVSDFYLRPFPQFNQVRYGSNDGRSYYDSLQVSLRRNTGALKFAINYTFSKSVDNGSVDGNGFTAIPDNFNLSLNRGRGDYDRPHALNYQLMYTLPIGRGQKLGADMPRWADTLIGGWNLGVLGIWQSGGVMSISSGRVTGPSTFVSYADYSGDRNIGSVQVLGDSVRYFDANLVNQFSFPAAGTTGTSGRNAFRGPRFFNNDVSLQKSFRIAESKAVKFVAEAYNIWNNTNFSSPSVDLNTPSSFGKISSSVGNPRIMQMTLRFDF